MSANVDHPLSEPFGPERASIQYFCGRGGTRPSTVENTSEETMQANTCILRFKPYPETALGSETVREEPKTKTVRDEPKKARKLSGPQKAQKLSETGPGNLPTSCSRGSSIATAALEGPGAAVAVALAAAAVAAVVVVAAVAAVAVAAVAVLAVAAAAAVRTHRRVLSATALSQIKSAEA